MFAYVCRLILLFIYIEGVFGADEVKSVSVTEGDPVTLNTDLTEIQRKDHILWKFGLKGTRIAEIHNQNTDMFNSNVTFGDRLQIDSQTGSLTITNIRTEHSGLYRLQINSDRGDSDTTFNVTVYAPLPILNISRDSTKCIQSIQKCSVVCSVMNVSHVTLSWLRGNRLLSSISVSDLSISRSLPLEVDDQEKNYKCMINNPIRNKTTQLDISRLCRPCSETEDVIPTLIYAVVGVTAVALLIYYVRCKTDNGCPKRKPASHH